MLPFTLLKIITFWPLKNFWQSPNFAKSDAYFKYFDTPEFLFIIIYWLTSQYVKIIFCVYTKYNTTGVKSVMGCWSESSK